MISKKNPKKGVGAMTPKKILEDAFNEKRARERKNLIRKAID